MIAIGRMQVAEREALYPSRTFNANDDDSNDNILIHTIQVQGEKKKKKRKLQKKEIDRDYITICTIFESVCNNQRSKAFQLAAVYLKVKKGTQE